MSDATPMQDLRDWLASMPPKLKKSTAVFSLPLLAQPAEYDASDLLGERGWEALDRWLAAEGERGGASAAASFLRARAVIRFFVIDHFCSQEGWGRLVSNHKRMLAEDEGGVWRGRSHAQSQVATADLTGRQWRAAGEAWESKIESAWSDARLRGWLDR